LLAGVVAVYSTGMNIIFFRGSLLETSHTANVVAVVAPLGAAPRVVYQSGPPTWSPWRSSGKPLQTLVFLRAMEGVAFSDEELAIASSSHSGQAVHVAVVRGVLSRFSLTEADLQCGAEVPLHRGTREALLCAGDPPQAIHNDCSGKYAMMFAACEDNGW